tara:strand:+ start:16691 stop:16960 length:270 start_codon:yes stop_codon:yes gene_type:complete
MLEGDYLELVNQLKLKYDTVEEKLTSIENREKQIRKDMMSAYGVIRLLDNMIDTSIIGYDNEIVVLVECLRGLLSDSIDRHVLGIIDSS